MIDNGVRRAALRRRWTASTILAIAAWAVLGSGCAIAPAQVTLSNTTTPVMLGPVARIGGAVHPEGHERVRRFNVEAKNLYQVHNNGYGASVYRQTEDAGKFDIEVLKALDACRGCSVRVDHLRVGAHAGVLLGIHEMTHWTAARVLLFDAKRTARGASR